MRIEILIVLFNIIFFMNNLLFITLMERIFDIKSGKLKVFSFSFLSGLAGTVMLVVFGSMSALGYGIMLVVYAATIMSFYTKQSITTRVLCVLTFNIFIMCSRAIIASVYSLISGNTIYELSRDRTTFWIILIFTAFLCCIINAAILKIIPQNYLKVVRQKKEYLFLYIATVSVANVYMISNGNVYVDDIVFPELPMHQIIASFCWFAITCIGLFMLVGFDMLRARRNALEKNTIYKQLVESNSIEIIEVNCTKDKLINIVRFGQELTYDDMGYTDYLKSMIRDFVYPEDGEMFLQHISVENIIREYEQQNTESTIHGRVIMPGGVVKWVRSSFTVGLDSKTGDIIAVITTSDDIHDLKSSEIDLTYKSQRDLLVGAYNKKTTELLIKNKLSEHSRGSLFMIDLDNFKGINDNFGHSYGDDVLKEVYEKIASSFRSDDIVGRVGGDEFIVFLNGHQAMEELIKKSTKICNEVHKMYTENGISVLLSCSIGVAIAPNHGNTFEELYHAADDAMYSCKKKNKNGFAIYSGKTE